MTDAVPVGDAQFDGRSVDAWASSWDVPQVVAFDDVPSTMDVAHALARAGASDATVVVADRQSAGRGRNGSVWRSPPGGAWCSILLRPSAAQSFDPATLGVFTLRVGLALALVIDGLLPRGTAPVRLKWPNDLWLDDGKLGGILTDAHWDGPRLGWLVVGVGINLHTAPQALATDRVRPTPLPGTLARGTVLGVIIGAVRRAALAHGRFDATELAAFARRDALSGAVIDHPVQGRVVGIAPDGALRVIVATGETQAIRAGDVQLPFRAAPGETPAG
ncbi:MAG: biotin--[acetyl-CoA-carboxylase] ligase [Gemmatimonadaceae bacterium]|jgi:BirA family biotin operon repressor/biotin-[acetyl-CoA-carboxylase] ligase|nr:biotin--[acetyl-CoA-carboxylase] ligase [Gemmatimonadaceae bacterium]